MLDFTRHPAVAAQDTRDELFTQTVTLRDGDASIGLARWAAGPEGVVQLLCLQVDKSHRRQGHGRRLLNEVIRQARQLYAPRPAGLRRMWLIVEQKQQIIARAFLMGSGFHHVATIKDLYHDQDALIYLRSFN